MFKSWLSVLVMFLTVTGTGVVARPQVARENVDLDAIDKIKDEGHKRSQVMEILSYLTDVHGPRLTNSPTSRMAEQWAKQKLAEFGLQNAHLEPFEFGRGWSLDSFSASIVKPNYSPLIAYPKAWSPSTNGVVRGTPVYFDAKSVDEFGRFKGKLKGAIVLLSQPREVKAHFEAKAARMSDDELLRLANAEPPAPGEQPRRRRYNEEQRTEREFLDKKWEMLYAEGPVLVLEPSPRGDGGTIFVQGATLAYPSSVPSDQRKTVRAKDAPPIIPQLVVAVEQYNRLIRMMAKGTPVQLEINIGARYHDQDLTSNNVIAEIPGTDLKDEVVMLGAHFDSWHGGTGATDNAAGSAVCMEAVRILKSLGLKPRRTIRIALWTGEEQGLLGSKAYVTEHFGKRLGPEPRYNDAAADSPQTPAVQQTAQFELKPGHQKLAGYFNLDNGTGKIRGIYLQGNEEVRSIFRAWFAPFKDMIGTTKGNSIATLSISNTGGTDHLSFDRVGLPGFQFIQDEIEYPTRTHHSNMDVYDRIQDDDMKQAAVIMASFVYNAAMRDRKLPRKALEGEIVQQGK